MCAKLIPRTDQAGVVRGYSFWCPACAELHSFNVSGAPPLWNFNGNTASPTFYPSLRYLPPHPACHLVVTAGRIGYCTDCVHAFAGKTVEMLDWDFENWRPIVADETKEPPQPKPDQQHGTQAGDVGRTGEHGDLGSNQK